MLAIKKCLTTKEQETFPHWKGLLLGNDGKAKLCKLIWFWTMGNVSSRNIWIFAPDDHCWANLYPIVFLGSSLQFCLNEVVKCFFIMFKFSFIYKSFIYLIQEYPQYCNGGDLADYLNGRYTLLHHTHCLFFTLRK